MLFNELKSIVKNVAPEELRADSDDYLEAVVLKNDLSKLSESFLKYLGAALYPAKNKLPEDIKQPVADLGGIIPGQTLYFKNDAGGNIFVLLWPWQDGQHITIKIAKK